MAKSKSKYAHVFARLTKILNTDPDHQQKVEAVKTEMIAENEFVRQAHWLAAEYGSVRREKAAIEADLSECQVRLDAVEQLMHDQFEVEGMKGLTLANGDKVRVEPALGVKFTDPEKFRLWCLADKDLALKMQLHVSTATALVKRMLEVGQPEPPGTEAVTWDKSVFTPVIPLKQSAREDE